MLEATGETLYMTAISALATFVLGILFRIVIIYNSER